MAKISELNTKSFLGIDGAATNSYVLINYEDTNTNEPVTCKATIEELGKSIAAHLNLTRVGQSGALSTYLPTRYNSWADDGAYETLSSQQKDFLEDLQENPPWASTGDIEAALANFQPSKPASQSSSSTTSFDVAYQQNIHANISSDVFGKIPVVIQGSDAATYKYGLYTVDESGLIPVNLANPFELPENEASITWGKNIFIADDSNHDGRFYVMGDSGPEEITINNHISLENTYNTTSPVSQLHKSDKAVKLAFIPIDSNNEPFNGIYGSEYGPINLIDNLKHTHSVENENNFYPVFINTHDNQLYIYDSFQGWQSIPNS